MKHDPELLREAICTPLGEQFLAFLEDQIDDFKDIENCRDLETPEAQSLEVRSRKRALELFRKSYAQLLDYRKGPNLNESSDYDPK